MSRDIWTRCAGPSRVGPLTVAAWRVVEAQHAVSTRRLVDTLEEQKLLEEIVDGVKPPAPTAAEFDGLHYLLFTPFRHPPLRHGSRFGSPTERSLWYGAQRLETSLAEKAYYQFVFAAGTTAVLENLSCTWSAFQASVHTKRGVDLTAPAFADFQTAISSPGSYAATQPLGAAMRAAGVDAFQFTSARCPQRGTAIGLFSPAFASRNPRPPQTWRCGLLGDRCEVRQVNTTRNTVLAFRRSDFEVNGVLPQPGVG
jgi:hypothetical protein